MKVENYYDYPLECFTQTSSDGNLVTIRSYSGPVNVYFWFSPEQALALAEQLKQMAQLAVECKNEPSQNL